MSALTDWLPNKNPIHRQNATEAVFDDIRLAINSGRLAVGSRLPSETLLAQHYGVSRPILREALRSLQTLGMTQTRTGSGTYVVAATPSPQLAYGGYSARDLMEARPFIEVPAAGWAAIRRTDSDLATLLDLCDKMDVEEEPEIWVRLDSQFHSAIAEASGNAVFAKIVADAREALTRQSEIVNLMADRRVVSSREHRRIVEAIAAGSQDEARKAMADHLAQVEQVVSTLIGEDPSRLP
jgi:DNA-binding FadR family transcriptional regulator